MLKPKRGPGCSRASSLKPHAPVSFRWRRRPNSPLLRRARRGAARTRHACDAAAARALLRARALHGRRARALCTGGCARRPREALWIESLEPAGGLVAADAANGGGVYSGGAAPKLVSTGALEVLKGWFEDEAARKVFGTTAHSARQRLPRRA